MNFIRYDILRSYASSFSEALVDLLSRFDGASRPLRFVFFGAPLSEEQYAAQRFEIFHSLYEKFGDHMPLISYVAQPPLASTLAVECQMLDRNVSVEWCENEDERYAIVEVPSGRMLFTGGVMPVDLALPIREQSDIVFDSLGSILKANGMTPSSIVRQWNYIEKITQMRDEGQNYQQFNDSRSDFYASVNWSDGYPAATGIGTDRGGVMVEVDAVIEGRWRIAALDNSLQVAAHEYSRRVLLGSEKLSTPKFERAKALVGCDGAVGIYVSGTAAIRGEESLVGVGIEEQTLATLENIEWLVGGQTMAQYGIEVSGSPRFEVLRVYLKFRSDYMAARDIIERRYPKLPVVYVLTDVCRDELLIEIEGVVSYVSDNKSNN